MPKKQAPERIALITETQDDDFYGPETLWVALPDDAYDPKHHQEYVRSDIHEAALHEIAELKKAQKTHPFTPDEIAGFEKRAAAGEQPLLPGWKPTTPPFLGAEAKELAGYHAAEWTDMCGNTFSWLFYGDAPLTATKIEFHGQMAAAQLAAEELIRRSTTLLLPNQ